MFLNFYCNFEFKLSSQNPLQQPETWKKILTDESNDMASVAVRD